MSGTNLQPEPMEILSIEDNRADVCLIREVFRGTRRPVKLNFVADGEEAMEYLLQKGNFANATKPDLILLDLNLPRKDGRQFLREIKSAAGLKQIPTIVLTTSNSDRDIEDCYQLHANCYVIKPLDLEEYRALAASIVDFWLDKARLPAREPRTPGGT